MSEPIVSFDSSQCVCVEPDFWSEISADSSLGFSSPDETSHGSAAESFYLAGNDGVQGGSAESRAPYAAKLFSNDGAGGAPGYYTRPAAASGGAETSAGYGLLAFVAGLIPIFSATGCGSEESVNPAPTTPCTPKEEWGGGGASGTGGEGGAGGAWLCPDYPDDYIYDPDEGGSGCDEYGNCW